MLAACFEGVVRDRRNGERDDEHRQRARGSVVVHQYHQRDDHDMGQVERIHDVAEEHRDRLTEPERPTPLSDARRSCVPQLQSRAKVGETAGP